MTVLRALVSLILSVGLFMTGHGLLFSIVSLRLSETVTSSVAVGLVQACYYAGLTLGALTAAGLVRAAGHIRTFAAVAALYAALTLAHDLLPAGVLWAALRFAQGLCIAALLLCVESWIAKSGQGNRLGLILAVYTSVTYFGLGLGQIGLAIIPVDDPSAIVLATLFAILAIAPVALTRTREPVVPTVTLLPLPSMLRTSPLGTATTFASGAMVGSIFSMAPVFGQALGLTGPTLGFFMAGLIIGGMALQFPLGRLSDFMDRRTLILVLFAALSVAGIAAAGFATGGMLGTAVLLVTVIGGLTFTLYPLGLAQLLDFVSSEDSVSAAAAAVLGYSIGATAGPVVASMSMEAVGPAGLCVFIAGVSAVMTVVCGWRWIVGRPLPGHIQPHDFVPVPRTTLVSAVLDPRTEDEQLSFDFIKPEPEPASDDAPAAPPLLAPLNEAASGV